MPTFVAATQAGDGQTTQVTSLGITIPALASIGDVALLFADNSLSTNSLTATGWTVIAGPDANSTNMASWVLTKALASGEPGSTLTLSFGATAARAVAQMIVFTGAGVPTSAHVASNLTETTATTTYTLPTKTMTAGSSQVAWFGRRRSGASGTPSTPSGYTAPTTDQAATAYGTGVNVFGKLAYIASSAGGTVGGETSTTAVSSVGNNYLVEVPTGQADATIPIPSAYVPVRTQDVTASASATQTVPSAFVPVHTQDVGLAADTALAVPSALVPVFSDPAAPGTAIPVPSAFVPVRTQDVALIGDVAVPVPTAYVGVHPQPVTLVVDAAVAVPSALVEVFTTAPRPAVYYRYQWWDGAAWHRIAPVVWDGTAWIEIPVTVTRPD